MPLGLSFGNCLGLGGHLNQDLLINTRYWDPSDIDIIAWYDASDDANNTVVNGAVTQWSDKSGNDNHLISNIVGLEPTRGTTTRNSLLVNEFDGTQFMECFDLDPGVGDVGIFIVANVIDADNINDSIFGFSDNNLEFRANSNVGFNGVLQKNDGLNRVVAGGAVAINGYALYSLMLDQVNGNISVFLNGTLLGSVRNDNAPGLVEGDLIMGANIAGDNAIEGEIGEVIFEDSVETLKRQTIEGYLAHKWGLEGQLPPSHPYDVDPPKIVEIAPAEYLTDENGNIMYDNNNQPILVQG